MASTESTLHAESKSPVAGWAWFVVACAASAAGVALILNHRRSLPKVQVSELMEKASAASEKLESRISDFLRLAG